MDSVTHWSLHCDFEYLNILHFEQFIDNIWINTVNKYKDKEFQNISCDNIDLNKIKNLKKEEISINDKEKKHENYKDLIKKIQDVLGSKVKDVIISSKLVNSPACLSSPEGSMNLRMEKFLSTYNEAEKSMAYIISGTFKVDL